MSIILRKFYDFSRKQIFMIPKDTLLRNFQSLIQIFYLKSPYPEQQQAKYPLLDVCCNGISHSFSISSSTVVLPPRKNLKLLVGISVPPVARFNSLTFFIARCNMILYKIITIKIGMSPIIVVNRTSSAGANNINQQICPLFVLPRHPIAGRNPIIIPVKLFMKNWDIKWKLIFFFSFIDHES